MQTQHSIHILTPKKIIIHPSRHQFENICKQNERKNPEKVHFKIQKQRRSNFSQKKHNKLKKMDQHLTNRGQFLQPNHEQKIISNLDFQSIEDLQNYLKVQLKIHKNSKLQAQNKQGGDKTYENMDQQEHIKNARKNQKILHKQLTPKLLRKNTETKLIRHQRKNSEKMVLPNIYSSQYFCPLKKGESFSEEIDIFFEKNFKDKLSTKQSEKTQETSQTQQSQKNQSENKKIKQESYGAKKQEDSVFINKFVEILITICLLLIFLQLWS